MLKPMKLLFLDYETLYSDEYSLKKMTPAEYILDARFQVNGCAVKEGLFGVPFWLDDDKFPTYLQGLDPDNTMTISHNALFDASILAWRYNFIPKITCCTLSVSRATINYRLTSLSLENVARDLKLGVKEKRALISAKGMNLPMIKAAGLYEAYVDYALQDVELCAGIFKKLVVGGEFPLDELAMLDMIMRMTTQPNFVLDKETLHKHLHAVTQAKEIVLHKLGCDNKTIRQDEVFANMLRAQGVEPPRKISLTTNLERYAFAKTDAEFLELEEHNDPMVQALVAARLGAKSTIEETRTQRFINISNLQWPITFQGNMPMPIKFSGAHTHRGGGDWKLNVQNMPRGGELRKSLKAPPGYKVITVDSSQIEARLVAFLANEEKLLQWFAEGQDVYSNFASYVFKREVTKQTDPTARYVGKTAILGLGFGLGWSKFQERIKTDSRNQLGTMVDLAPDEAMNVVLTYRRMFSHIPETWDNLGNNIIPVLTGKLKGPVRFGPVVAEMGTIYMPGRLKMFYHNLRYESATKERRGGWTFTYAGKTKFLYGGKILENIVQYLDRILVFDAALRIQKRIYPYRLAQQAHDENCYVVKEEDVVWASHILMEEMTRRPVWGENLPIMAEIGVGDSYGEAK